MKTFFRGSAKRALAIVLVMMMLVSLCAVGVTSASAANVDLAQSAEPFDGSLKLYLQANDNWLSDNARFAAYYYGDSGEAWSSLTLVEGSIYEAVTPDGSWTNIIFCRMDPSSDMNDWGYVWNQTSDLEYTGTNNLYVMDDDEWDFADKWEFTNVYTPAVVPKNTATIYVNSTNSSLNGTPKLYVWDPATSNAYNGVWPGSAMSGPDAKGFYYCTFNFNESYKFIINDGTNQTIDSPAYSDSELRITFTGGLEYTLGDGEKFWVDLNPGTDDTEIDLLYPEKIDGTWYLFLPSGADASALEFHYTDGLELTISSIPIENGGSMNLSGGVNSDTLYTLGGSFSGNLAIMQSQNTASVHTVTEEAVPQGTGYGGHKDDYSTKGTIQVTNADGTQRLSEAKLKKIKGRGNSSWEASNEIFGKYAFNITLDKKTDLIKEGSKTSKYCLVSYNADEARMRNMLVYDLAQEIGIDYVTNFEPVDLYNNGQYIGSYLLVEKVEIGDPLVDITNLDKINENATDNNTALYDDDSLMVQTASNGNLQDASTPGYYKYISNLNEPNPSSYADSGFLLEFELNERFANEISGFISTKGQQIVCKYPEYATKNEMLFIMNKWNTAEALMYNENATYEELNEVIDVESFAKMYLIQEITKNLDAAATSYYVFYDGGKLHAGVTWDYDWTLGQYIQSGNSNLSVVNQTSGKFKNEVTGLLNDPEGWWANSKEIYPSSGTLNAQAALCQNDNFWNIVKAEWNEVVYDTATLYSDSTVTSTSVLDGKIKDFYDQVHYSTLMDEFKWGFIEDDPILHWGSAETGDTHDAAVVYLNNFFYNRIQWMNDRLGCDDYVLPAPVLTADKENCVKGDTVTFTATTNSSGNLTYSFYKPDGTLIAEVTSSTGSATCEDVTTDKGTVQYSVVISSDKTTVDSEAGCVYLAIQSFTLTLKVDATEKIIVGGDITATVTPNTKEEVTYNLLSAKGDVLDTNTTGIFTYSTQASDAGTTLTFMITAEAVVDGERVTALANFSTVVDGLVFGVVLTAQEDEVVAGSNIVLTAVSQSSQEITYYFYNAKTSELITSNKTGVLTQTTKSSDKNTERTYYVRAVTEVLGMEYEAFSTEVTVFITSVKDVYTINVYFKSTSSYGYRPKITTTGAARELNDVEMTRDIFICKNATSTASYYWYKTAVTVAKTAETVDVMILSNRYAMEAYITLDVTGDKDVYLAVDDLNCGEEMVDLTDVPALQRNWCESAVHMVYDPDIDGEEALASVAANVNLRFVGDSNGDGKVNIKDATYIQKFVADLTDLDAVGEEISDVDGDGRVTIKDATAIQKQLVAVP